MNNFEKDLLFGQSYEKLLIPLMSMTKYKSPIGLFKGYDIVDLSDEENPLFFEVKADKMAHKTGNIAIEFECFNKRSGIETSTADYWAVFVVINEKQYNLYMIPRNEIIKMIINKKYFKIVDGGDYNRSKMYLFKLEEFKNYLFC